MAITLGSVTTWVKENPMKAAGIAAVAVAGITLLVSKKARKFVGLGGVKSAQKQITSHRKKSKKGSKKAKTIDLK